MAQTDKSKGERLLAVTAIGRNRPDLALDLIRGIAKRGCHIRDCHVSVLADCLSMSLLVCGNWSALGKLESALPQLAKHLNVQLCHEPAETAANSAQDYRPYACEIIAPVGNELLTRVVEFLHGQNLRIHELSVQDYRSSHTGAEMCTMSLVLFMHVDENPQNMREAFMDLCDELNADGIFDPIKN